MTLAKPGTAARCDRPTRRSLEALNVFNIPSPVAQPKESDQLSHRATIYAAYWSVRSDASRCGRLPILLQALPSCHGKIQRGAITGYSRLGLGLVARRLQAVLEMTKDRSLREAPIDSEMTRPRWKLQRHLPPWDMTGVSCQQARKACCLC